MCLAVVLQDLGHLRPVGHGARELDVTFLCQRVVSSVWGFFSKFYSARNELVLFQSFECGVYCSCLWLPVACEAFLQLPDDLISVQRFLRQEQEQPEREST